MDRHSDLTSPLYVQIEAHLGSSVRSSRPVTGGDVAAAFRVELTDERVVFAKTHADPPANFFDTEARGLAWLADAGALPVPQVLAVGEDPPMLVLEWIDESPSSPRNEHAFGAGLARLHDAGAPTFGREDKRTTGSRGLPNEPCDSWVEFYATQRLLPLARLAVNSGVYSREQAKVFELVADRLNLVGGPSEPAARLHGDLWAGNRIVDGEGASWLIDPACHGGHREFDLAMMQLFGGFDAEAFDGYEEHSPLADGWEDRVKLHQLAPLLVHAIKFGGGYVGAALDAAQRYC